MAKSTVTVGCKLPSGLRVPLGGGEVHLVGTSHRSAIGGYGLTPNVDADAFNAWFAEAKAAEFAPVVNGFVIVHSTQDYVAAEASEKSGLENGFEPLDPDQIPAGLEETPESKAERLKTAAKAGK